MICTANHVVLFRPEVNIAPWEHAKRSIADAASGVPWEDRAPKAQWKGTVWVARELRGPVVECNDGEAHKWGVESRDTAWGEEKGKASSKLESQCGHR